jgi:hypothetical protein
MANVTQNKKFSEMLLPQYPLDEAIEWIKSNLEPEDVFGFDRLNAWASANGFIEGGIPE